MVECVDIRANLHFGGKKAKLTDLLLTGNLISWRSGKKNYSYSLEYVIGAATDLSSPLKFKLCIFNLNRHKFKEYSFYCVSPDHPTEWVNWILKFTYASHSTTPRTMAVIVNPISGGKKGRKRFNKLFVPIAKYTPIVYKSFETTGQNYFEEWSQSEDVRSYSDIITLGGDGTIHLLVSALYNRPDWDEIRQSVKFGTLPTGSRNALACALGGKSINQALFHILKGFYFTADQLRVTMEAKTVLSSCAISWGFISSVSDEAQKYRKFGPARYSIIGIKKFFGKWKKYEAELWFEHSKNQVDTPRQEEILDTCSIVSEGGEQLRHMNGFFTFISITNNSIPDMESNEILAPLSKINDGCMDMILLKAGGRKKMLEFVIKECKKGKHINMEEISYLKVNKLIVHAKSYFVYNIDGEMYYTNKLYIDVMPRYIQFLGKVED